MTFQYLSNPQLKALMQDTPNLRILDVRTPEEFEGLGHIPSAMLIPIHELPQRLSELKPEQKTVVICEHGVRSEYACQFLQAQGFQALYNLTEGMAAWDGPRDFS